MRLQSWLRWLKLPEQEKKFTLIKSKDLETFINVLKERELATSTSDDYIHGIIIDVMWKKITVTQGNFHLINYPDVKVNPFEAGIQLLSLIFKSDSTVPSALLVHKNRKIAVFSSLRGIEMSLGDLQDNITILHKTTCIETSVEANRVVAVLIQHFKLG